MELEESFPEEGKNKLPPLKKSIGLPSSPVETISRKRNVYEFSTFSLTELGERLNRLSELQTKRKKRLQQKQLENEKRIREITRKRKEERRRMQKLEERWKIKRKMVRSRISDSETRDQRPSFESFRKKLLEEEIQFTSFIGLIDINTKRNNTKRNDAYL